MSAGKGGSGIKKKWIQLLHGGFDPAVLHACREELDAGNLEILKGFAGAGALASSAMTLLTLWTAPTWGQLAIWLLPAAACLTARILAKRVLPRVPEAILTVWYGLLTVCCLCAILCDTALMPTHPAATFLTLVLALPLMVPDVPWRIGSFLGGMVVLFGILTVLCKAPELARIDILRCTVFYLTGVVAGFHVIRSRVNDLLSRCLLRRQRDTDCLTGLSTRRYCETTITEYLALSEEPAALLLVDVDQFKQINDQWGHDRGDELLQLLSEQLRTCFRRGDVLGRLGGDEFIAFLPRCWDRTTVEIRAQAMLRAVGEMSEFKNVPMPGISVGIAMYPENGCTFDLLYRSADSALYTVKKRGRGYYAFCEDPPNKAAP